MPTLAPLTLAPSLPRPRASRPRDDHAPPPPLSCHPSPSLHPALTLYPPPSQLVNDASPLVRDALAYPLADSLASSGAQKLADELRRVGGALVAAHREGVLPDGASPDFEAEWKSAVKSFGKELGLKGKSLFMPLRLAVTGRMAGPDVGAQLQLLALAPDGAKCESVPLDARMAQLEAALADMPVPVEA